MIVEKSLNDGYFIIKHAWLNHKHSDKFQLIQIKYGGVLVLCTKETVAECEDVYVTKN